MKVISLDLDETLIRSRYGQIGDLPSDFKFQLDYEIHVYVRPHIKEFLDFVYENFDHVGVFTTSTKPYAKQIVQNVFGDRKLDFFFTRNDCRDDSISYPSIYGGKMWHTPSYVKDLYKVAKVTGASMNQIVAVDDQDVYDEVTRELQNLIRVKPYQLYESVENTFDVELTDTIETLKLMINSRAW